MLVTGVDENGLGPRLGPLVATALTLEITRYSRAALQARGLRLGLTDSKDTGGFGRMAFTESIALGLLQHVQGSLPPSADALLRTVFPGVIGALRGCCPDDSTAAQCWGVDVALPAFGGDPALGVDRIRRLVGRSSLRLVGVESRVACAGLLNSEAAAGRNKLEIDLRLFEELIDDAAMSPSPSRLVICGMIGGIRDYRRRFSRFDVSGVQALPSRRGQRRYEVPRVGEVRFEVDADARHLPVALASIVGKYVREVCMLRIGAFYRRQQPGLRLASGYHDPVTTQFIRETEPARHRLGVVEDCFRRRA